MHAVRLAVVLLVCLAGCASLGGEPPDSGPDGTRDVSISVQNDHDRSYTVEVDAVPPDADRVEVTYENGSTRTVDGASIGADRSGALRNATGLTVLGADSDAYSRAVRVAPNEGMGATLDGVPSNATIVYVVRAEDGSGPTRGAGVVRCAPSTTVTDLALTVRADGTLHSQLACLDAENGTG
jgi:hypothetical protein